MAESSNIMLMVGDCFLLFSCGPPLLDTMLPSGLARLLSFLVEIGLKSIKSVNRINIELELGNVYDTFLSTDSRQSSTSYQQSYDHKQSSTSYQQSYDHKQSFTSHQQSNDDKQSSTSYQQSYDHTQSSINRVMATNYYLLIKLLIM